MTPQINKSTSKEQHAKVVIFHIKNKKPHPVRWGFGIQWCLHGDYICSLKAFGTVLY
jgi:hypothetical protein